MRLAPPRPLGGARALPICRPAILALLVALLASGAGSLAPQQPAMAQDAALAEPVPLGDEASAGPLRLRVLEVVVGQEATDRVLAASPANDAPREDVSYVLVNVAARNEGERPVLLAGDDFALTGDAGLVRRVFGLVAPAPAIDGLLDPGATREGWLVLAAPVDEGNLLLLYDSLSLPGVWADRLLALQEGAALPAAAAPTPANDAGVDPAAPAGFDTPVVTAEWRVELLETATGAAVFDLVDYRTQALGVGDATGEDTDQTVWVALRLRITDVRADGGPVYLPSDAFTLVDENGSPLPDLIHLTPPRPEASGAFFPGAAREGWIAFDVSVTYAAATVRFLPYAVTAANPDPRYLTFA